MSDVKCLRGSTEAEHGSLCMRMWVICLPVGGGLVPVTPSVFRRFVKMARNFIGDSNVVGGVTSFGMNGNCAGTGGVFRMDRANALDFVNGFLP